MPIAGGRTTGATERFDLATCPPDGYIVIRRMEYGDKMMRRGLLGKATVKSEGRRSRSAKTGGFEAEMQLINENVTLMEFSKSIIDHNLTILTRPGDASSEVPLDFSNPVHVRLLDGRVGEEIDEIITDYNDWEADEETGKLKKPSEEPSSPIDQ